jgi:hypothetical protein
MRALERVVLQDTTYADSVRVMTRYRDRYTVIGTARGEALPAVGAREGEGPRPLLDMFFLVENYYTDTLGFRVVSRTITGYSE